MFSLVGICVFIVFILLKPQDYFTFLQAFPLLYIFLGLALFGFAIDLRLRKLRPEPTPHLFWVILFCIWGVITLAVRSPGLITSEALHLIVPFTIYLLIGHGVQSFRALQVLAALMLTIALFLSFVGVHQGLAPMGCFQVKGGGSFRPWDGRACIIRKDCEDEEGAEPGADYGCEHVGLFGTQSIAGRVRFLGTMEDPNELSLVVAVGLPFAFAFFARRPSSTRFLLLAATISLVSICCIFTQSRGGQLVFLTVLGVYFVRRFGLKGLILGAVMAVPVLLLGGRDSEEAAASSLERLECWYNGMQMFRESPIFGVGMGQFTEHHYLTAHNSFVLAAAELGLPGMILWCTVVYISVKIPIQALRLKDPAAGVARTWALSLIAAWFGLIVGVFLLSFCYKELFWVFVGLSGGLYSAVRTHVRDFEVKIYWWEIAGIAVVDCLLIVLITIYTTLKT